MEIVMLKSSKPTPLPSLDLGKLGNLRQRLARLAAQLGAPQLKEAAGLLAQDRGNGKHAIRALGCLRGVQFRHGGVDDARRDLSRLLAA